MVVFTKFVNFLFVISVLGTGFLPSSSQAMEQQSQGPGANASRFTRQPFLPSIPPYSFTPMPQQAQGFIHQQLQPQPHVFQAFGRPVPQSIPSGFHSFGLLSRALSLQTQKEEKIQEFQRVTAELDVLEKKRQGFQRSATADWHVIEGHLQELKRLSQSAFALLGTIEQQLKRPRLSAPEILTTKQQTPDQLSILPEDILNLICLNYLHPIDWANASKTSRYWNNVFGDVSLWKETGKGIGGCGSIACKETNEKAFEIFSTLIKKNRFFANYLSFGTPKKPFNEYFARFLNVPDTASKFRDFYAFKYLAALSSRGGKIHYFSNSNSFQRNMKSKHYCERAYAQGHPEAAWEKAKLRHTQKGLITDEENRLYLLQASFGGISQAREELVRMMRKYFFDKWQESEGFYEKTFKDSFDEFIKLAHIWPEVRIYVLNACAQITLAQDFPEARGDIFSNSPNVIITSDHIKPLMSWFEMIGNGTKTPFILKIENFSYNEPWPEAFLLLGIWQQKVNDETQAQAYFIKAFEKKASNSALTLATYLQPIPEYIKWLKKLAENPVAAGTAYSKIGEILIKNIPQNAAENDLASLAFLKFFEEAHAVLKRDVRYLPPFAVSNELTSRVNSNETITNPAHFIEELMRSLYDRERSLNNSQALVNTRNAFLDLIIRLGHYNLKNHWIQNMLKQYLNNRWDENFTTYGKLDKKYSFNKWNARDILFSQHVQLNGYTYERNLYEVLMGVGLKQNDKETFTVNFKNYYESMDLGRLEKENCECLSKNLTSFLHQYPDNAELPFLFGKLLNESKNWEKDSVWEIWQPQAIKYLKLAMQNGSKEAEEFLKSHGLMDEVMKMDIEIKTIGKKKVLSQKKRLKKDLDEIE